MLGIPSSANIHLIIITHVKFWEFVYANDTSSACLIISKIITNNINAKEQIIDVAMTFFLLPILHVRFIPLTTILCWRLEFM